MNIKVESKNVKPFFIKNVTEEYIRNLRRLLPDATISEISEEEFDSVETHPTLKLEASNPVVKGF